MSFSGSVSECTAPSRPNISHSNLDPVLESLDREFPKRRGILFPLDQWFPNGNDSASFKTLGKI